MRDPESYHSKSHAPSSTPNQPSLCSHPANPPSKLQPHLMTSDFKFRDFYAYCPNLISILLQGYLAKPVVAWCSRVDHSIRIYESTINQRRVSSKHKRSIVGRIVNNIQREILKPSNINID